MKTTIVSIVATIGVAAASAVAIPSPGIMHGFVQTQAGAPYTGVFARVSHLKGEWPFNTTTMLTPSGEFVVSPNPGTYLVELVEDEINGAVVDEATLTIQSNITTFVFFTFHVPDTNADDVVDVGDLVNVITAWGACPDGMFDPCPADTNGDAVVDVNDLINVVQNWTP